MKYKTMFTSECYENDGLLHKTKIQNKHFWILVKNNDLSSLHVN